MAGGTSLRLSRLPSDAKGSGPFNGAGAPTNGVLQIQTITFGGTGAGSSFRLKFNNQPTAAIVWSSTNATLIARVKAALEALSGIGSGNTTVAAGTLASGIGTMLVTFSGSNSNEDHTVMTLEGLVTGGSLTVAIAITTHGVLATGRTLFGAPSIGALYIDVTNAALYFNVGTAVAPYWIRHGTKIDRVPLVASDAAAGVFSWQNPEINDVIIEHVDTRVDTVATGACSIDIGQVATNIKGDNLVDGLDVHTATGIFGRLSQAGANGSSPRLCPVGQFVTGSMDSGATAGLVGFAYVHYYSKL